MIIEKNIPVPERSKYPFCDMKVGDSILLDSASERNAVISAANYYRRKHNENFRITTKAENGSLRVWRTQ